MTDHLNCKVFDFVPQELLRSNNHYGDSVAFSIPEVRGRHCEALSYSDWLAPANQYDDDCTAASKR